MAVSDQESGGDIDAGADLEYDLAHEVGGVVAPTSPHGQYYGEPVVTVTPEYDGDYSYDLAHDIPRSP
jgi:hypothetical protein